MRLEVLDRGHRLATKALFALIRLMTRQPVSPIVKLIAYRPDYFGGPMKKITHEAMRGSSTWSVGDRELMAAFVSHVNACQFCIKAHTAVAARAYGDAAKVAAALADPDKAPISEPLRATLEFLRKLTRDQTVGADDVRMLLAAGVFPEQVEDALAVGFAFNTINRLADAFDFLVPGPEAFEAGAKFLLAHGYR